MLPYDTPALRQTGSRNLTGPKNAPSHKEIEEQEVEEMKK
jgi:hypothetical protein